MTLEDEVNTRVNWNEAAFQETAFLERKDARSITCCVSFSLFFLVLFLFLEDECIKQ